MLLHFFLLLGELPSILIFSNINVCGRKIIIASKVTQTDKTHLFYCHLWYRTFNDKKLSLKEE